MPPITVLVRPEVLHSIASTAERSPDRETGGPLIGGVQPSWEPGGERLIVAVLGVVPPGPGLHAGPASVAMGRHGEGERAATALRWWRVVTGMDLRHLGDWHKHPSGLPEPSGGDRATAQRLSSSSEGGVWFTVVTVGRHLASDEVGTEDHVVRLSRSQAAFDEIRFYREGGAAGLVPIQVRLESEAVPRLPDLPWHITDPVRFGAECRLLRAAGFGIAIEPSRVDGSSGVAFRLDSDGEGAVAIFTTSGYPMEAPTVIGKRGRANGELASWTPNRFLVDLVKQRS